MNHIPSTIAGQVSGTLNLVPDLTGWSLVGGRFLSGQRGVLYWFQFLFIGIRTRLLRGGLIVLR
jgi:hypothetical protein